MPTLANKAILIIELGIILDIPANDGLNTEMFYDSDITDLSESVSFAFSFLDKKKPQVLISQFISVKCNASQKPQIVELKSLILLILPLVAVKVSLNRGSSSPFISPPAKNRNRYPLASKDHEERIPSRYCISRLKATKETAASAPIAAQADRRAAIAGAYAITMTAKLELIRNINALLNRERIKVPAAEPATPSRSSRSATQAKPGRPASSK